MKGEVEDMAETSDSAGNRVEVELVMISLHRSMADVIRHTLYSAIKWSDNTLNIVSFDVALSPV